MICQYRSGRQDIGESAIRRLTKYSANGGEANIILHLSGSPPLILGMAVVVHRKKVEKEGVRKAQMDQSSGSL